MEIISHRGYWIKQNEKNSIQAFHRTFNMGFGTETDIRDSNGQIVISHDIPMGGEMLFDNFCAISKESNCTLALNIKSDGLAKKVKEIINLNNIQNWFVFDMSIPDMISYINIGCPVFTRLSDIESIPYLLNESIGVWLDSFQSDWYNEKTITDLLGKGKKVCIVSPELHGRESDNNWNMLMNLTFHKDLILCTDYPEKAKLYFNI